MHSDNATITLTYIQNKGNQQPNQTTNGTKIYADVYAPQRALYRFIVSKRIERAKQAKKYVQLTRENHLPYT
jgi:hypothetical protein